MARITFVITNDKHHLAMMAPVARALSGRHQVDLLSFCEVRGLRTPPGAAEGLSGRLTRVPPFGFRSGGAESLDAVVPVDSRRARELIRTLAWNLLLRHLFTLDHRDVVVVPHDVAFPCNRVCRRLRALGIPFVLVQEGVRYPLPAQRAVPYGTGGADALAVWGPADVDYFGSIGVERSRLHPVGNPRYDAILAVDWKDKADALRARGELPARYLVFASNTIDAQGFCTREQKLASFGAFVAQALPLLKARGLDLAVKLHGRDSRDDYARAAGELAGQVVFIAPEHPLHAVLAGAQAVVNWASTVGLEAMLHDVPVGVLETPGHGHVFDYVSTGAAVGLRSGAAALAKDFDRLLSGDPVLHARAIEYLDRRLACRGRSTAAVAGIIDGLASGGRMPAA
ncbi:MAG TPA: hypothetical protein VM074_11565 [Solimonas sp.]|nr:hypothetical protein [Solimonas sp.]